MKKWVAEGKKDLSVISTQGPRGKGGQRKLAVPAMARGF